jgi:hypothetical protein
MSLSKPLPRNSGEILNTSLSRRPLVTNAYPRIELALVPGWARKSLVHDGLDVNYKTRPFAAIHPSLPKVASHVRAAQWEKALMGTNLDKKRFSLFSRARFPSK